MFEVSALERLDALAMSRRPAFLIAVDEGNIAKLAQGLSRGRTRPLDQTEVFILAVNRAEFTVFLDESNGEKLSLAGFDEFF